MERAGPQRTVLAGIDVGKFEALALVADGRGELLGEPLVFALDEPGVASLEAAMRQAAAARSATLARIGVEACGYYQRCWSPAPVGGLGHRGPVPGSGPCRAGSDGVSPVEVGST